MALFKGGGGVYIHGDRDYVLGREIPNEYNDYWTTGPHFGGLCSLVKCHSLHYVYIEVRLREPERVWRIHTLSENGPQKDTSRAL
jgi:hypothetical protein